MASDTVALIRRGGSTGAWDTSHHSLVTVSSHPVTVLLPIPGAGSVYACAGRRVMILDNSGVTLR